MDLPPRCILAKHPAKPEFRRPWRKPAIARDASNPVPCLSLATSQNPSPDRGRRHVGKGLALGLGTFLHFLVVFHAVSVALLLGF